MDRKGKLRVYRPPSGDGGGEYEVAGITQRYFPKDEARLKKLIEQRQYEEAEQECKEFWRAYGDAGMEEFACHVRADKVDLIRGHSIELIKHRIEALQDSPWFGDAPQNNNS